MRRAPLLLLLALSIATGCDGCKSCSQPGSPGASGAARASEGVPFDDVVLLAAGFQQTCVVVASGATYCAGGALEAYDPKLSMARRVAEADHTTQLSIGESACAVQESGQVVCWSDSRNEVLPRKRTGKKFEPDVIPGLPPTSYALTNEAALPYWALARDGSAWQWGGTILDQSFVAPTKVDGLTLNDPVQVASNHNFFCARLRAGGVTCWDWQGYLDEGLVLSVKYDLPLGSAAKVVDIAVSYASLDDPQVLCVLDVEGRATCWRYTGETLTIPEPFRHPFVGSQRWKDIAMGSEHSCGVARDETVWCTGRNRNGELGVEEPRKADALLKVPGVAGAKAVTVGYDHSCALLSAGAVVCWGSNFVGQCGAPGRAERVAPTPFLRFIGKETGS